MLSEKYFYQKSLINLIIQILIVIYKIKGKYRKLSNKIYWKIKQSSCSLNTETYKVIVRKILRNIIELKLLSIFVKMNLEKWVFPKIKFEGIDIVKENMASFGNVIILTSHHFYGIPSIIGLSQHITKSGQSLIFYSNFPLMRDALKRRYNIIMWESAGKGGFQKLKEQLLEGNPLVLPFDEYKETGVEVIFLEKNTKWPSGVYYLSLELNLPIFLMVAFKEQDSITCKFKGPYLMQNKNEKLSKENFYQFIASEIEKQI